MSRRLQGIAFVCLVALLLLGSPSGRALADNPNPPTSPVKLIFIHHSTGGHWLADPNPDAPYGGLGRALMNNNYYVSATNYGWGPEGIGDRTDIVNWPEWFTGPNRDAILRAVYTENGQNFGDFGAWPRLASDPGGENRIVMFKSCFPNSDLYGAPNDPPLPAPNDEYTVANAKAVYNNILTYLATRQDKLFVVITAPPLAAGETAPDRAANARAFNNWLVNDWLDNYPYANVAVFDYYNVLTSNGGNANINDLNAPTGNHHRWWNGAVQHLQTVNNNYAAYPSGDSHPSTAGQQKATGEFVQWLNVFYHRWQSGAATPSPSHTPTQPTATPTLGTTASPTPRITGGLRLYLPLILKDHRGPAPTATATLRRTATPTLTATWQPTATPTQGPASRLVQPGDLVYLGAFRLPEGGERPLTFAYGGSAMTFRPDGDPSGPNDGFPGSLLITGHDRLPYGELPNGSQVAEISIPAPINSKNLGQLRRATFLQGFHDVTAGLFAGLDEIPRIAMQYLNVPATGPKVHLAWGQHLQEEVASHAWFNPDLAHPNTRGPWFIGEESAYSVNGYMLEIPAAWADAHVAGRYLGTGRFRDGGWSGMGPALFAYRPWVDTAGNPAPAGTHLPATVLLRYQSSRDTESIEGCLNGYQHPDEWEGAAWITTPSGKTAVLFAGTKATGAKYWYGYVNPAGPQYPCVDEEMVGQFEVCRLANGQPCPPEDLRECPGHNDYRGWWSSRFDAWFLLYDPADLAKVASGQMQPWEPQAYAILDVDDQLLLNPAGVEEELLGTGVQRRYRLGEVAYDRANGLLYVLELYADEAQPVVHVWRVQ